MYASKEELFEAAAKRYLSAVTQKKHGQKKKTDLCAGFQRTGRIFLKKGGEQKWIRKKF